MLLKLKNIGKIYDSNNILTIGIRNVNLGFEPNEFVIIEGESGSGKSTLLNIIGANDTYEEGELYFNGGETSHYTASDWEKYREENISTIFQDFNIIENLTVLENVELALFRIQDFKERKKIAKELISKVGLINQTNQKGSRLSGGEKQRTVIARALAKDSPIILADEPTGNLDVKSSREIAALLKSVSKDKLVILVTHNASFFSEYATRKIRIFDGKVTEDKQVADLSAAQYGEKAKPTQEDNTASHKKRDFKNTLWLGALNYKSRPKFTAMMSFALCVCSVAFFIVLSLFGQSLIKPLYATLDSNAVEGKVIIAGPNGDMSQDELNELAFRSEAGYSLLDRRLSEFSVNIPKKAGMLQSYDIVCLYAPHKYSLEKNEAVLILPFSSSQDEDEIKSVFINSGAGIESIHVKKTLDAKTALMFLGYETLIENGSKIQAINSTMKLGEDETLVYSFEINDELETGKINLVNSDYWDVKNKSIVFGTNAIKSYIVNDDKLKKDNVDGVLVQMNSAEYNEFFASNAQLAALSCLYFGSDSEALSAISKLPDDYIGMLSGGKILVQGAGKVFLFDTLFYFALVAVSLCFGMLISIIFMRSVKIYQTDFAVYRTLGITRKIASRSLYIQMTLIFLPSLILLPLISLIAAVLPGSAMSMISLGNYFIIELMTFLIVQFVAFGFNKSIKGHSIRKSLRRSSK